MLVQKLHIYVTELLVLIFYCYRYDIDRLTGGKDIEFEMEAGVKQADVIIIYLNDRYVQSVNCQKEYLYATRHGKYIIPVLLKDYSSATKNRDSTKWWPDSMTSLAQFDPIPLIEEAHVESALTEICERIQSRFHRASRFPTSDDAITYIRDYSSWGDVRKAFLKDHLDQSAREAIDNHLEKTFDAIDKNGDSFIDEHELVKFLDTNKLHLSREQIQTVLAEADIDCDGLISLSELKLAVYASLNEGD